MLADVLCAVYSPRVPGCTRVLSFVVEPCGGNAKGQLVGTRSWQHSLHFASISSGDVYVAVYHAWASGVGYDNTLQVDLISERMRGRHD